MAVRQTELNPLFGGRNPICCQFAHDRKACPYVFAAFMVMRGSCEHGMRQLTRTMMHPVMKLTGGNEKASRIEANVVPRYQAAVTIERGILNRFGAKRRTQLLKPGERERLCSVAPRSNWFPQKPFCQNIDQPDIAKKTSRFGVRNRSQEEYAILIGRMINACIHAVNRKMNKDFNETTA